ncbi:hypothetical protein D6C77_07049 [Aureobasidium pullulans]|nr:hypothetical protein D6C77_07049 [Aureobasidium pullulans]
MGDSDVSMSGVEPDDGLLAYGIPYPPALDDTITFSDGSAEPPDWEIYAKYYGARFKPGGNGFDVRLINFNDPSGEGKYFEEDWPYEYHLGAPDDRPDGWDPPIQKWGLKLLDAAGFINNPTQEAVSYMAPHGKWAPERQKYDLSRENVHPVFRCAMWPNISQLEYAAIMPALLLATAYLDDPKTLCLFHAISAPSSQMTLFRDEKLGYCQRVQIPATLSEIEQKAVFDKMVAMREYTTFNWADDEGPDTVHAIAWTSPRLDAKRRYIPASGPFTRKTDIYMSTHILHVMSLMPIKAYPFFDTQFAEEILDMAGVADERKPRDFDLISAQMRTAYMFAATLVHEFAHAFCKAYFERPDTKPAQPNEPWLADNRNNELGHAVILQILGGIPGSNTLYRIPMSSAEVIKQWNYVPFGIHFREPWDMWAKTSKFQQVISEGAAEANDKTCTFYPIAQRQIQSMYAKQTWDEVSRYGLDAIKLTKIPEWAAHVVPGETGNYTLR